MATPDPVVRAAVGFLNEQAAPAPGARDGLEGR